MNAREGRRGSTGNARASLVDSRGQGVMEGDASRLCQGARAGPGSGRGALGMTGRGREGKGVPGGQLGPRKNSGVRVMPAGGVRAQGRGRGAVGGALGLPGRACARRQAASEDIRQWQGLQRDRGVTRRKHKSARVGSKRNGKRQEGGKCRHQSVSRRMPGSGRGGGGTRGHPAPSLVSECGARQWQRGCVGRAVGVRVEGRGLGSVRGAL